MAAQFLIIKNQAYFHIIIIKLNHKEKKNKSITHHNAKITMFRKLQFRTHHKERNMSSFQTLLMR